MLNIQKNKDLNSQLSKVLEKTKLMEEDQTTFLQFLDKTQNLYKSHSKKISNQMVQFEEKTIKANFYSTEKTKIILNIAKIYRQFASHWERVSQVNLINIERIDRSKIEQQQNKLYKKSSYFIGQYKSYQSMENSYKSIYDNYCQQCKRLDEIIEKFQSYSDPLLFYNQLLTSQYLQELQKRYNKCVNQQAKIFTELQLLDQKRQILTESLKQVRQAFVLLLHNYLTIIQNAITYIVDPSKDSNINKQDFVIKQNSIQENQKAYIGQIDNLLLSSTNKNKQNNPQNEDIFADFGQLFQKQNQQNQLSSEYKFFHDRCQNIKNKKIKRMNEILKIQHLLVDELKHQISQNFTFQKKYKEIQKEIFKSDGLQTFKKNYRRMFGANFTELYELCMTIVQRPRKSLQKIIKEMNDCFQKLEQILRDKSQSLSYFQKRSNLILDSHQKTKIKIQQQRTGTNSQQAKRHRDNVTSTTQQFKKSFVDLESTEKQTDKIFFKILKNLSDMILKEAINKSLSKTIQKQKNRMEILQNIKIDSEVMNILKQDQQYQIFFSDAIKPELYKKFQSSIKKKEYQETKKILQMKQSNLSTMVKHKITCCGIKSEPIKHKIIQKFKCQLLNGKQFVDGNLNVLNLGITFEQKSFNPFANLMQVMLPQAAILSYQIKPIEMKEYLSVNTDMGPVYFFSEEVNKIIQSMRKNIVVKIKEIKELSEKDKKRQNSSNNSFLRHNSSQQIRLQFQKSTLSSFNRLPIQSPKKKKSSKNSETATNYNMTLKHVQRKLLTNSFLSDNFTVIIKQMPIKDQTRSNFQYKNGHHKFILKEKKISQIVNKILSVDYSWKISFPENSILKSFKHHQTVRIQLNKDFVHIKIVTGPMCKDVTFAKNKFYEQMQEMNKKMYEFIVQYTQKQGAIIIEPQDKQIEDSLTENMQINPDDIIINNENENFPKFSGSAQNFLRSSRSKQFQKSCGTTFNLKTKN